VIKIGGQEINVFSGPAFVPGADSNFAGIGHFCLNMDAASIDEIIVDLRQAGIETVRGPVERRDGTSVFVYDPDGIHVELRLAKGP